MKLILMPGMDGTGELFAPLIRALGTSIESIVVRYPTDEPLTYSELLTRVRTVLPVSEPFVLLGESFSGPLALMLAAEAPAGLRGVILCASFATSPIRWFPKWARGLVRPTLFQLTPRFAQVKALLGRYATPELRTLLIKVYWRPCRPGAFRLTLFPNPSLADAEQNPGYRKKSSVTTTKIGIRTQPA